MDLPDCIVDDLRVDTAPLLTEEFVRVCDEVPETVLFPEYELGVLVLLLLRDCRLLFVLPEFELSVRYPVLLVAVLL